MRITPASAEYLEEWSRLRVALWDLDTAETHEADALLDNIESHNFQAAIGFAETERVVYFRKSLA
jgi:aminoglycoside 6'-N-acetyltransferase I